MNTRTKIKVTIGILLVVIIILSTSVCYIQQQNENQKKDIDSLKENTVALNTDIEKLENNITTLTLEIEFKTEAIHILNNFLQFRNDSLQSLKDSLRVLNMSLQENIYELNQLRSGNKYETHDPTYEEVMAFLEDDLTDEMPYNNETFICLDYAVIVNNNAEALGIRCCVAEFHYNESESAHAIIGFNTTDGGMIYIEPQSDKLFENFFIGGKYGNETINRLFVFW